MMMERKDCDFVRNELRSPASLILHAYTVSLSLQDDKMADLVLWKPAFFGAKPEMVLKSGQITWSQMGKHKTNGV